MIPRKDKSVLCWDRLTELRGTTGPDRLGLCKELSMSMLSACHKHPPIEMNGAVHPWARLSWVRAATLQSLSGAATC